jgi:ABC-2 type transport system permease protein
VGLVFIGAVFARVPHINGWGLWEVVLIYACMTIGQGCSELFAEGTWHLSSLVNRGEFDRMLVRPLPVVLQVCSYRVGMNAFGTLSVGGVLLVTALAKLEVAWTPARVVLAALVFLSALVIKVCLTITSNASAFWLGGTVSTFAGAVDQLGDLTRYPMTIYGAGLRLVLSTAVPFAFVGFFPASFVLGHGPNAWLGLLTPIVAAWCVLATVMIFRRGMRRYEGSGN